MLFFLLLAFFFHFSVSFSRDKDLPGTCAANGSSPLRSAVGSAHMNIQSRAGGAFVAITPLRFVLSVHWPLFLPFSR
jgi:hypothetical protein